MKTYKILNTFSSPSGLKKAEYYGYKQLSKYIRDAAIYEKVTVVDLIGKNEILKAYSDNTQILKEMHKSTPKKRDLSKVSLFWCR